MLELVRETAGVVCGHNLRVSARLRRQRERWRGFATERVPRGESNAAGWVGKKATTTQTARDRRNGNL